MSDSYKANELIAALISGSQVLSSRKDEINRLNVFPVPDGDTGTNMSLTLESVIESIKRLPEGASDAEVRRAITTGALMGARGNSGVITSQILRGLCEAKVDDFSLTTETLDAALNHAVEVAFQAVRKPVKGTILTVLEDMAGAARQARKKKLSTDEALAAVVKEGYASVERTPEFLPVLKENNVVDAGGFGLAILIEALVASLQGESLDIEVKTAPDDEASEPKVFIEQINDWEGSEYRYCTEFLVHSDTIDVDAAKDFLPTMGDCDLMVGMHPNFKVHVHSNRPDQVLGYFLTHDAQISEVHVHNMDLQSEQRNANLAAEQDLVPEAAPEPAEEKEYGFVAVASGSGNVAILESLGIDVVVSGGQTMNPSTKDLLEAAQSLNARNIIFLPNNSNIVMAAQSAASLLDIPAAVVPTKSLPQAFSAMFAFDEGVSIDENVEEMTDAAHEVKTGEVTYAVKDSRDRHGNPIAEGDVIGIADGELETSGNSLEDVVMVLLEAMEADDADTVTLLAGEDYDDEALDALSERIEEAYPDLEIDAQRGEQPLYPIVFSVE